MLTRSPKSFKRGSKESMTDLNKPDVMKSVALKSQCNLTVASTEHAGRVCRQNRRKVDIGYSTEKARQSLSSTCPSSVETPSYMTCNM